MHLRGSRLSFVKAGTDPGGGYLSCKLPITAAMWVGRSTEQSTPIQGKSFQRDRHTAEGAGVRRTNLLAKY